MTATARAETQSVEVIDLRWSGTLHHVHLTPTWSPAWTIEVGFTPPRHYTYELSRFAKANGDLRWEVVHFEIREKAPISMDQNVEKLIDLYVIPYLVRPRSAKVYSGILKPLHPFL